MNINLYKAAHKDAIELATISQMAFDDEINYGAPFTKSGPPGYDAPNWQTDIMDKGAEYYRIHNEDELIGGVVIQHMPPKPFYLKRLFITPLYQNQGVGSRVIQILHDMYPDAKQWFCATPTWNKRTIHFYLKNGFTQKGIIKDQFNHFDLVRLEIDRTTG